MSERSKYQMKKSALDLKIELVRKRLQYDPETGIFVRGGKAGTEAGTITCNGYRQIGIDGHSYLASRLAWFYVNGHWPTGEIDHKNGVRLDNRLDNLRDVSHQGNGHNERKSRRNNRTGFLGVTKSGKKFASFIGLGGKTIYLGSFSTAEAAHASYVAAKRKLHSTCTI